MRDYSKILPHLDGIKKIADKFDGQDRELILKMLFEDAMTGGMVLKSGVLQSEADIANEMPTQKRRGRPPGMKKKNEVDAPPVARSGRPPKAGRGLGRPPKLGRPAKIGRPPKVEINIPINVDPSIENVRDFLVKHDISENTVRKMFAIGDESVLPVYDSLGTDKKSQAQVRVMLLNCFAGAIASGRFIADLKAVREDCKRFNIYDNNFPGNLARQEEIIKRIAKSHIELTDAGQDELATLLKTF